MSKNQPQSRPQSREPYVKYSCNTVHEYYFGDRFDGCGICSSGHSSEHVWVYGIRWGEPMCLTCGMADKDKDADIELRCMPVKGDMVCFTCDAPLVFRLETRTKDSAPGTTEFTGDLQVSMVINKELKMSKGKIAAQAAHALHLMTDALYRSKVYDMTKYYNWMSTGAKIVALGGTTEELQSLSQRSDAIAVRDAGRTEVEAGSLTVVCLLPSSEKLGFSLL